MLEEQGNDDDAEDWYRRAADHGEAKAMYNLARRLAQQGRTEEALEWYRQAAERGDAGAAKALLGLQARQSNPGHHEIR